LQNSFQGILVPIEKTPPAARYADSDRHNPAEQDVHYGSL